MNQTLRKITETAIMLAIGTVLSSAAIHGPMGTGWEHHGMQHVARRPDRAPLRDEDGGF